MLHDLMVFIKGVGPYWGGRMLTVPVWLHCGVLT